MNPLTDKHLPYNDALISQYADAFVDIPENNTLLNVYAGMKVVVCRGIFIGYLHAYSLLTINAPENETMTQLKLMIHAVCKRIRDGSG